MPNHVNSCVLCVCLLFNFCLFTVIDLSPRVLFAQHPQWLKLNYESKATFKHTLIPWKILFPQAVWLIRLHKNKYIFQTGS